MAGNLNKSQISPACGNQDSLGQRRQRWLDYKLRSAAYEGDLEYVKKAHSQGAQINGKTQSGWTALDFSVRECHDKVSSYLRSFGGSLGDSHL
jgi:ankyrin repeat protein